MTLYQLQEEYRLLLELAEDPEVDTEIIADTLEALGGDIEEKAIGYGKVIKELESDAERLKAEEARLNERRKRIENNVFYMKQKLQLGMEAVGKKKIETDLFTFRIQKNPASVVMDETYIENLPEEYLIPQSPKVDRAKIREDLKAGKELEFAHLVQTESLRIK